MKKGGGSGMNREKGMGKGEEGRRREWVKEV